MWALIVFVLGNTIQTPERLERPVVNGDKDHGSNKRSQGMLNVLNSIDCVPSNVQSSHLDALLYVFEDNEAVIKIIIKRSPTMKHVSRAHRVALDWIFDRINLDPKIKIKYIDTKNQLADILTKGKFTRYEWNHLLCLFNISHFSSAECSEAMAKRLTTRFRRRTSHSKIATNDEPCCKGAVERIILDFSKPGEEKLWKSKSLEYELLRKRRDRGRPDIGIDQKKASDHYYHEQFMESFSSASYSKWDDDRAWSSQEWKTDTEMYERSGKPDETSWRATRETQPGFSHEETHHDGTAQSVMNEVIPREKPRRPDVDSQGATWPQEFVNGNDEAELELSVESRSFVNWVNDQVRKRQKRISNVTEDGEKDSMIWGMFMTVTMESAVFMGKNYLNNCQSIANTTDLT